MKLRIRGKCNDCFNAKADDVDYLGYVPRGLGIGGGDYISFTLDTETGKIEEFTPLTDEEVANILDR